MIYGYVRVSTREQNEARQVDAMKEFVVDRIYMDKQSGKDFNRPHYMEMVDALNEGDVLVLHSIDRLGRNYDEILEQWRVITKEKRAHVVVLDMPLLDTRQGRDTDCGYCIAIAFVCSAEGTRVYPQATSRGDSGEESPWRLVRLREAEEGD